MEDNGEQKIRTIWNQKHIPVIYRRGDGPLMIKLPYAVDNRIWIKGTKRNKPKWNSKYTCWETPKAWFNDLVTKILSRHKKVYVIQPYRKQEKCAPSCWNAKGHECQCSCMGEYHGTEGPNGNWLIISDTFATLWHEKELACRLITDNR